MITARKFAKDHGIPDRTVTQWITELSEEERAARGIVKAGQAWVAPLEAWKALAAVERRRGPKPKTSPGVSPQS